MPPKTPRGGRSEPNGHDKRSVSMGRRTDLPKSALGRPAEPTPVAARRNIDPPAVTDVSTARSIHDRADAMVGRKTHANGPLKATRHSMAQPVRQTESLNFLPPVNFDDLQASLFESTPDMFFEHKPHVNPSQPISPKAIPKPRQRGFSSSTSRTPSRPLSLRTRTPENARQPSARPRTPERHLKAKSIQYTPRKTSQTSTLEPPSLVATPTSARRASVLPNSVHATGLAARTISPTDARRLRRLSVIPPLPVSQSMTLSPSPINRQYLTPPSTRATPERVRAASITSRSPSIMMGPPSPQQKNVPPVPAIPKVFESPREDKILPFSGSESHQDLVFDKPEYKHTFRKSIAHPPAYQETDFRKYNSYHSSSPEAHRRTLQPLRLPPLRLGPLASPTSARIASMYEGSNGVVTPPLSADLRRVPDTPLTASRVSHPLSFHEASISRSGSAERRPQGSRKSSSESTFGFSLRRRLSLRSSKPQLQSEEPLPSIPAPMDGLLRRKLRAMNSSSESISDREDALAEEEMRRLASRRKETEDAARLLDKLRRQAQPRTPSSPESALQMPSLNIYERGEIMDYKSVYFCGKAEARKCVANLADTSRNFGYDDERGDYNIVLGDHLGYRYEVVDILGKGSFGQVVRCIDHEMGCLVAIKIIRNKKRFHQQALVEVDILQKLREWDPDAQHSMVSFTQAFYFRGHLCISTELLDLNLYEFIKIHDFRGVSLKLIRRFAKQLLSSLVCLKAHHVIHCDLKPENILLAHPASAEIKVIDFGSSCMETEKVYTYIQSRFYRSPEVILGMSYGLPIDMWSLGCILAELLTGYPIFPGENEQEQLACIMEVFGPPEKHLIEKSTRKKLFFDSFGKPRVTVSTKGKRRRPSSKTLAQVLKCEDPAFLDFVTACLRWDPDRRLKPEEALVHDFITGKPCRSRPRTGPRPMEASKKTDVKARDRRSSIYNTGQLGSALAGAGAAASTRRPTTQGSALPRLTTPKVGGYYRPSGGVDLAAAAATIVTRKSQA